MSVEQWKRAITLVVLGIILALTVTVIIFVVKSQSLQKELDGGTIVDLSEYEGLTTEESRRLLNYWDQMETGKSASYQSDYPDLYVDNDFQFAATEEKVCYLTFDDGPTPELTSQVLDILKEHDIKATFFVIGKEGAEAEDLYKRIVDEGHTIGVHSYSHDYEGIYQSVDAYLADFNEMSVRIESLTGTKPEIFRFPGGSVNGYNVGIHQEIIAEMLRRGYTYYDWNVSSRDTVEGVTAHDILQYVAYDADEIEEDIIVLMHDGENHMATVEALPDVIKELKRQGFTFAPIGNDTAPICFGY